MHFFFIFAKYVPSLHIHSFPTRRSSDLTRSLEDDLDKIEQGKGDYARMLAEFYKKFKKDLTRAGKEMIDLKKGIDRKSTRLNSSHRCISYAVFCLKKKKYPRPLNSSFSQ